VTDYMSKLGVTADRLKVVSFGEEKPLSDGNDIEAFARNRRVDFELLRGGTVRLVVAEGALDKSGDPIEE
jgi:peptidoglycan-associated lipoprotein